MAARRVSPRLSTETVHSRADLDQEYEVERARAAQEGRPPRKREWVEADYFRRLLGRRGQKVAIPFEAMDRIASVEPQKAERQSTLIERAVRIALGLPDEQRQPILAALRFLAPWKVADRIAVWLEMNPHRVATHREIAADTGVCRVQVTRAISKLRQRRRLNAQ